MKRGLIAAGAVAMLLLTGCTAQAATEQVASSATPSTSATTEAAAPLAASTPTAPPDGEAEFAAQVRSELGAKTVIPNATDEQLKEAGHRICELKAQGVNPDDWTVIDGEQRSSLGYYNDSAVIAKAAVAYLCD